MSPSAVTIWQSYSSNKVFIFLKLLNNYLIWIYNYVIYCKTLSLSSQKWAVEYNKAELWHSPKCSRYNFSSKNLLTLLSFVFLECLDKMDIKKTANNFSTWRKGHLFPHQLTQKELRNTSPAQETLSDLGTGQTFMWNTGIVTQSLHCALQAEVIQ